MGSDAKETGNRSDDDETEHLMHLSDCHVMCFHSLHYVHCKSTDRTMQRSFAEVIDWRVGTRMTHDPRTSRKAAEGAWE